MDVELACAQLHGMLDAPQDAPAVRPGGVAGRGDAGDRRGVLVLAVPSTAIADLTARIHGAVGGKIVVDPTNPLLPT